MSNTLFPLYPPGMFDTTPLEDGYIHHVSDVFVVADMEQGPADVERAFVTAPTIFDVSLPMDWFCFETWRGWLAAGGGLSARYTADIPRGDGIETMTVRVRQGVLQPELRSGEWTIKFQLETMDYLPWPADKVQAAMLARNATLTAEDIAADLQPLSPLFPQGLFDTAPLEDGFAQPLPNPCIYDDIEPGPVDVARGFVNAPLLYSVSVPMDWTCYEIWIGWLFMTGGTSAWHKADLPRGDGNQTMRVRIRPGTLAPELHGGEWIAKFQLETMDCRAWGEEKSVTAILTYGGASADDIPSGLETFLGELATGLRELGEII
jgi:hypothetical protein